MIAAVAVFSGMDALLKLLSAHYPPMEVTVLRGAASLPFMLLPLLVTGRWRELRMRRFPMHLLRGLLGVVSLGGFVYAVRVLSLANAYAVFLSAPLIVTALSVPLLKERVDARNWGAILLGLAGVLTMLRPSAAGFVTWGALAALIAASAYALSIIAVRVLTRSDSTASVVVWTVGLMTAFAALIAAPDWVPLERVHWRWLVGLGGLGALGSYLLTAAFRSAPASVVAPFEYTSLLWGIAIDRVVWHVLPSMRVCLGGGLVIGGLTALPQEAGGPPPHWLIYVGTPSVDASCLQAQSLGARVLKAPADIPNVGRFAVLSDPQGATFALFTPGSGPPPGPEPLQGGFSWHELATTDVAGAARFYGELFGWRKGRAHDMGAMGTYQIFEHAGNQAGGMCNVQGPSIPPSWLSYVHVADSNRAVTAAKATGGRLMHGPIEVPGGSWIALMMDPQGGAFAVQEAPRPATQPRPATAASAAPRPATAPKPALAPQPTAAPMRAASAAPQPAAAPMKAALAALPPAAVRK